MKARVPQLTSNQRKLAKQEIDKIWEETEKQKYEDLTRRILKTFVFVMYTEFGWGTIRLNRLIKAFNTCLEQSDTDIVYWEHIDRAVIDHLGLNFGKRDYTENGKVVNYD